jgi:DNA-binding NtrC family response regulator
MAKILVIDDSDSIRELVLLVLTRDGHEVVGTSCGRECIAHLQRHPVDLLITDIFMPEVDGLEIILQAKKLKPEVRVIAMSSKTGKMDMLPAAKAFGASLTLHKPFSLAALSEAVRSVLPAPVPTPACKDPR